LFLTWCISYIFNIFSKVFGAGGSITERATKRSYIFSGESKGFSLWIRLIRAIVFLDICGLPGFLVFNIQWNLKAFLCHFRIVSGLTRIKEFFQFGKKFDNKIHN
jgi:hypothetical protein